MDAEPGIAGRGWLLVRVNVKKLVERYDELERRRQPWDSMWQDVSTYVFPGRYPGMESTVWTPDVANYASLFDSTAVHGLEINANGCLSWMTPAEAVWFAYS